MTDPRSTWRPVVGVMGSGRDKHETLAKPLGELLARLDVDLLTGGGQGVMAAVSESFYHCPQRQGRVIGIIPCQQDHPELPAIGYPNEWVETAIFTHLWKSGREGLDVESRNHINILSSDAIIALPGEAGTLSEVRLALRYKDKDRIMAYLGNDGTIGNITVGSTEVRIAQELSEVEQFLEFTLRRH